MSSRLRRRWLPITKYHFYSCSTLTVVACDSLADGPNRHTRPNDQQRCECKPGWSGINCNLCQTDDACNPLMPEQMNGTCYKGGLTVNENFQMCRVINRKIIDQLDPRVPEVTFSCHKEDATCAFQCTSLPYWLEIDISLGGSEGKLLLRIGRLFVRIRYVCDAVLANYRRYCWCKYNSLCVPESKMSMYSRTNALWRRWVDRYTMLQDFPS